MKIIDVLSPFGVAELAELERRLFARHVRRISAACGNDVVLRRQLIAEALEQASLGEWRTGSARFAAAARSAEAASLLLWLALRSTPSKVRLEEAGKLLRDREGPAILERLWLMAGVNDSLDDDTSPTGLDSTDAARRRAEIFDAIGRTAGWSAGELSAKSAAELAELVRPHVRGEVDVNRLPQWVAEYANGRSA